IELTEPTVVAVEVDEHIDFEEAPVAAFAQTFAHLAHELAGLGSLLRVEDIGCHLIAAPAARIRGEFGETGQIGEIGADYGSAGGDDGFDGDRGVADPFHHLQLLADDVVLMPLPIRLSGDEERRLPRIAVRGLYD